MGKREEPLCSGGRAKNSVRDRRSKITKFWARRDFRPTNAVYNSNQQKNPGRSGVRDFPVWLRYYLGNLIDYFDVNDVAIDSRDLLVLAVIGRVVVNGSFLSVIGRVIRINWVWIIVVY